MHQQIETEDYSRLLPPVKDDDTLYDSDYEIGQYEIQDVEMDENGEVIWSSSEFSIGDTLILLHQMFIFDQPEDAPMTIRIPDKDAAPPTATIMEVERGWAGTGLYAVDKAENWKWAYRTYLYPYACH